MTEATVHVIIDRSREDTLIFASLDELTARRTYHHLRAALCGDIERLELDAIALDDDAVVRELLDGRAEGS